MGTESGLFKMLNREQVIKLCEDGVLTWTTGASTLGISNGSFQKKVFYPRCGF